MRVLHDAPVQDDETYACGPFECSDRRMVSPREGGSARQRARGCAQTSMAWRLAPTLRRAAVSLERLPYMSASCRRIMLFCAPGCCGRGCSDTGVHDMLNRYLNYLRMRTQSR